MEVGGPQDALDNRSDDNDFDKNDNSDPVVYQLVRVEGDGTLIPATEDEVLQFETFLHDEKVDDDLPSIDDVTHVEEYFTNDCIVKKPEFEGALRNIILSQFLLYCHFCLGDHTSLDR
jgi:hypothetical protein